jgi:hypothetical protein
VTNLDQDALKVISSSEESNTVGMCEWRMQKCFRSALKKIKMKKKKCRFSSRPLNRYSYECFLCLVIELELNAPEFEFLNEKF